VDTGCGLQEIPGVPFIESPRRREPSKQGGGLIGYYTGDGLTSVVTEALPASKDSRCGPNWFHRGIASLQTKLKIRWEWKRRRHYIGEWHYHPATVVEPSSRDLTQMSRISEDSHYQCQEPLMCIVGRAATATDRPTRIFIFPRDTQHLELYAEPYKQSMPDVT